MFYTVRSYRIPAWRIWIPAALLLLVAAVSCSRSQSAQKTFASPEEAGAALLSAAQSGNEKELVAILGPDTKQFWSAADSESNKANLQAFATAYGQMHRWREIKAGGQVLLVGADNEPFPIPLGRKSLGRWYFDTAAGKDEILARRIGKNELTAMDAAQAIAGAEQEYFKESHDGNPRQYAQKLVSDPGKHDGLYWPAAEGQPASPLGRMGDFTKALESAADTRQPPEFNGYRYRVLTHRGNGTAAGFVILAYPAEYRNSGIMSFMIDENGIVYQKDLGEKTPTVAANLTEVNPADGWTSTVTQAAARGSRP